MPGRIDGDRLFCPRKYAEQTLVVHDRLDEFLRNLVGLGREPVQQRRIA